MHELIEHNVNCPYCGEGIDVLIDQSDTTQDYIEDCQVCCRPIRFIVVLDDAGDVDVTVRSENE